MKDELGETIMTKFLGLILKNLQLLNRWWLLNIKKQKEQKGVSSKENLNT